MTRKPGMSSADTRQRLLDSAAQNFAKNGFASTSLRTICSEVGVTTGALYFFFDNKDDLFAQMIAPLRDESIAAVNQFFGQHDIAGQTEVGEFERLALALAEQIMGIIERYDTVERAIMNNADHPCVVRMRDELNACFLSHEQEILKARRGGSMPPALNQLAFSNTVAMQTNAIRKIYAAHLSPDDTRRELLIAIRFSLGGFRALASMPESELR